ncbi:MAG: PhzF family phenazine biosynthesis protein [Anaerolineales bacterium]
MPFYQVDAFTSEPFKGNPAVVCLLAEALEETKMQQIAAEMNLSETAFLQKQTDGYSLRWFTPRIEVDLCGHATLASEHVLWESSELRPGEQVHFHTRSGILTAEYRDGLIYLDFPALACEPATAPGELIDALGIAPKEVWKFGAKYLIEVETENDVCQMGPDFAALRKLPGRGVVVTSLCQSEAYDITSRYFAPWVGVDEDPVTGSAHCCLGPYWGNKLGKTTITAYQASSRGGVVHIQLKENRVCLGGNAVTVAQGEFVSY